MKTDVHNKLVDYKSLFWTPDYIELSAWIEHIPFAFWLTEVIKPTSIVELGVHNGTSYFSFCQAVQTLNINTTCYAVDTWQGDEHAGFYNDAVYNQVVAYNTDKFSRFSTLIRSTFDEANKYFTDGSIDLLHIDGLHTYEAVKHDFETWLPRLSKNAIVLFHDINVRERDFGVFKFWEELKRQYPNFQFDFGHGLGVLAIGEVIQEDLKTLFDGNDTEPLFAFLRNLFAERGRLLNIKMHQLEIEKHVHSLNTINNQLQESVKEIETKNQDLITENEILKLKQDVTGKKYTNELSACENKIQELDIQVKNQLNELQWYKTTYEHRSVLRVILGLMKTALRNGSIFNKKIKKHHLNPANHLIHNAQTDEYRVEGSDPYFIVDLRDQFLQAGWYQLLIEMKEVVGEIHYPVLYFDLGNGFNEQNSWNLIKKESRIESLIYFPGTVKALRFDPTIYKCTFIINEFNLNRVNKPKSLQIAISAFKKAYYPNSSYFSFFRILMTDFLKRGKSEFRRKLRDYVYNVDNSDKEAYSKWFMTFDTIYEADIPIIKSLADKLAYQPLISIILPVYNAPIPFLKKAIESVRGQAYSNWELCIADDKSTNSGIKGILEEYRALDKRIKVVFRETNGHICHSSNSALELATGDYIALLDHDDELRPHSLYMVAKAINENSEAAIIYSDEDKIDEDGIRFDPYFKTDWNKDLFYSQNMISHLGVYKRSLAKEIGGFRTGYEGSQDYDLALRCIERIRPDQICHIPHVLYHWRAIKGSTALAQSFKNYAFEAALKALNDHFARTNQRATAIPNIFNTQRLKWELPQQKPLVSIIIPTKDKVEVLSTCVESIFEKTDYKNFEIIIVDNNSTEKLTLDYFSLLTTTHENVKVLPFKHPFNFSSMVNYGVQHSNGEIVVLLNNDTEVINAEWLSEMVSHCLREDIGAVGAKLYFPNGQIQHAGVFVHENHPGIHIYLKHDKYSSGYHQKLILAQNYVAVTGACLAIRKELYLQAGGFDEANLRVAYNDVDFCLKVRELGYRNLFTPYAELFHHESLSRGSDFDKENYERFLGEQQFMITRWHSVMAHDPFFNPNLDINTTSAKPKFAIPPYIKYEWQN
jgi:glycosyltransferase involved in cell wall biosynthesis